MSFEENMITEYKERIRELTEENIRLHDKVNEKINVHQKPQAQLMFKIQQVKEELTEEPIKMTGYNEYQKYNYFELRDFVPCTVKLFCKYKLSSTFYAEDNILYLEISDADTGEYRTWHTPLKEKEISGGKGDVGLLMKNQQALQTYGRRTLWLQVLELVEPNTIEQYTTKQKKQNTTKAEFTIPADTPESIKQIFQQIRKDFGNIVEFNQKTIANKLKSMNNSNKIDKETYEKCMEIVWKIK